MNSTAPSLRWISASSGTITTPLRGETPRLTRANRPGRRWPSSFSISALIRSVRVAGSTVGEMNVTTPLNTRSGNAPTATSMSWPGRTRSVSSSVSANTTSSGSSATSSTSALPGCTNSPSCTERRAIMPANGAVTLASASARSVTPSAARSASTRERASKSAVSASSSFCSEEMFWVCSLRIALGLALLLLVVGLRLRELRAARGELEPAPLGIDLEHDGARLDAAALVDRRSR